MIKLVVDSSCDLSMEFLKKNDVRVCHFPIIFGDEIYYDGLTISSEDFYKKTKESKIFPKTSQISEGDFKREIEKALEGNNEVLVLPLSMTLSGTYNAAVNAKDSIGSDKVHIFDTHGASMLIGALVMRALEEIEKGKSIEEIKEILISVRNQENCLFLMDTLEYLKKGGRISSGKAFIGEILNVKPILKFDISKGQIYEFTKAKGFKQGIKMLVEYIKINRNKNCKLVICHCANEDNALLLKKAVELELDEKVESITTMGAVIGSHTGPGCVYIGF